MLPLQGDMLAVLLSTDSQYEFFGPVDDLMVGLERGARFWCNKVGRQAGNKDRRLGRQD